MSFERILHTAAPLGFLFWIWKSIILIGWPRRTDYCQGSPDGHHRLGLWLCRSWLCRNRSESITESPLMLAGFKQPRPAIQDKNNSKPLKKISCLYLYLDVIREFHFQMDDLLLVIKRIHVCHLERNTTFDWSSIITKLLWNSEPLNFVCSRQRNPEYGSRRYLVWFYIISYQLKLIQIKK
jgi:hypothetical protein